jgi:hypothetical protein
MPQQHFELSKVTGIVWQFPAEETLNGVVLALLVY